MIDDMRAPDRGATLDVRPPRPRVDRIRRHPLLPSLIALLSALLVLTVFGIGRMPSRLKDDGSAASAPERPTSAEPPVPTSESSGPAG
jgi:hypothetical protein